MRIHESVFWGIVFFLAGVFVAASMHLAGIATLVVSCAIMVGAVAYWKRNKKIWWFAWLCLLAIIGAMYWVGYNVYHQNKTQSLLGTRTILAGIVQDIRKTEKTQRLTVRLDVPSGGAIAATVRAYPVVEYGDRIRLDGAVKRPDATSRLFLMKDGVFAQMTFPQLEIIEHDAGNPVKTKLLAIKESLVETYQRALPSQEAALLAGITIGERSEFSAEFKQQMANSGTTHLVALSGYNISVVAGAVLLVCGLFLRRTPAFYATIAIVVGFVIMAGAEASVVRAAIIGTIVLLGSHIGRAHSMRNAIAISALMMVLWNPNVLRYDLGFQLSFMALLGIVYVKPYVDGLIKRGTGGFMAWRENLSGTVAAQLAVFPILIHQIGTFSAVSLLSNILILAFVPMTMALGFIIGGLGFVSYALAAPFAMVASLLLQYELGIIRMFGAYKGFVMPMSALAVVLYYVIGGGSVMYMNRKKQSKVAVIPAEAGIHSVCIDSRLRGNDKIV